MDNREVVGVSAEIAIADEFGVPVPDDYRRRGDKTIINSIRPFVREAFVNEGLAFPIEFVGEHQSIVDFVLQNGESLSVKTNVSRLDKVAPQKIGQPTINTYFEYLSNRFSFDLNDILNELHLQDSPESRKYVFKKYSIDNICCMLDEYWVHLFECDHYIHFYRILNKNGIITNNCKYIVLNGLPLRPVWDREKITFTKSVDTWNVSCTVKYDGIGIGEFEVHQSRNCLKFRFNIRGILKLLNRELI